MSRRVLRAATLAASAALLSAGLLAAAVPAATAAPAKYSQAAAEQQLKRAGARWVSSHGCSNRGDSKCTSFDHSNKSTVAGVVDFKKASKCAVTLTAGTEKGHASGTYSHRNGYRTLAQCSTRQAGGGGHPARSGPKGRSGMAEIALPDDGVVGPTAGRAGSQACGGRARPTLTGRQWPVKQEPEVVPRSGTDRNLLPSGRRGRQKVDMKLTSCVDSHVTHKFRYVGERKGDRAKQYKSPSGNVYAHEGSHWDVTYYRASR